MLVPEGGSKASMNEYNGKEDEMINFLRAHGVTHLLLLG